MTDEEPDDFELDDRLRLARQNVPWHRSGYPHRYGSWPEYEKWGPYNLNIGVAADRLKDDKWLKEHCDADMARGFLRERAFAELWDFRTNHDYDDFLASLLGTWQYPDEHTRILMQQAVQAVVQWLGTNCGQGFLEEAKNLCVASLESLYPEDVKKRKDQEVRWIKEGQQREEQEIIKKAQERIVDAAQGRIAHLTELAKADAVRLVESEMRNRVHNAAMDMYAERRDAEVPGLVQQVLLNREESARQDAERMVRESPLGGRHIEV
jgi:hypothetical protein